ncbi:MAG TPA: hypothetical protein VFZ97_05180 [Acidimicrobiales bacterium]
MADEEMTRAEGIAKRASELAARAEELARHAHEVAGVDEELAKLESELDALVAEEEALDAGLAGEGEEQAEEQADDRWVNLAESLAERMEALGDRLGDFISGSVDSALHSSLGEGSVFATGAQITESEAMLPVSGPLPVRVRSPGGNVDVRPGLSDRVHVAWRGRGSTLGDLPPLVTVQQHGSYVMIESVGTSGWRHKVVHMDVSVPSGSPIEVVTGGGSIRIEGTNSAVRARTGGGSITVAGVNGEVDVTTGGGSVHVDGRLSGQSNINTGGGSIDVVLHPGTQIDIDAVGTSASIDVPGLHVQGHRVCGSVAGGDGGHLRVRTGGGRARVTQQ